MTIGDLLNSEFSTRHAYWNTVTLDLASRLSALDGRVRLLENPPYPEPVFELTQGMSWEDGLALLPKTGGGTLVVRYQDPIVVPSTSRHSFSLDSLDGKYLIVGERGPNGEIPHITTDVADPCGSAVGLGRFSGEIEIRDLEFSNFKTRVFGVARNDASAPQKVTLRGVHAHHVKGKNILMGSNDEWPNWWTTVVIEECDFHHAYVEHIVYGGIIGNMIVRNSRFHSPTASGHAFKDKALNLLLVGNVISNCGPDGEIVYLDPHPYSKGGPSLGMAPVSIHSYSNVLAIGNEFIMARHAQSGDACVNIQQRMDQAQGHPSPPYYPEGLTPFWSDEFWAQAAADGIGLEGVQANNPFLSIQWFAKNVFNLVHNPGYSAPVGVDNWGTYPLDVDDPSQTVKQAHPLPVPPGWFERSNTVLYEGDDLDWANQWIGPWGDKAATSNRAEFVDLNPGVRHHIVSGGFPEWFRTE